jgi:hypothetical protein
MSHGKGIMIYGLERIPSEALVSWLTPFSKHLYGSTEVKPRRTSVGMKVPNAEIPFKPKSAYLKHY